MSQIIACKTENGILMTGYCAKNQMNPFQLYLIWTNKKLPLEKQSAVNEDVSGPFSFASITPDGFGELSD